MGDNPAVRKLLALLLLAVLPLTPSWAGVAVDCPSGAVIAQDAPAAAHADEGAVPDCCGDSGVVERQCGSDCTNCHGMGFTALTGLSVAVGVIDAAPGECEPACLEPEPLSGGTFRPPSARLG